MGACKGIAESSVIQLSKGNNISLVLGNYTNSELEAALRRCKGVIIPYDKIGNSGVLYQAISESANLLLPRTAYTEEVLKAFDYKNYLFYEGQISHYDIENFFGLKFDEYFSGLDVEKYNEDIMGLYSNLYTSILS